MESILTSIKKLLGIAAEYEHFDQDLVMHINSVFMILTQIGIGPVEGFAIEDKSAVWFDFISDTDPIGMQAVKSYMFLKTRMIFDSPSGAVAEASNNILSELEWRLQLLAETKQSE